MKLYKLYEIHSHICILKYFIIFVKISFKQLCRYLLGKAPSFDEKHHSLRLMFGNGLHKDIWSKFISRFRVPSMIESYASTEGKYCSGTNWMFQILHLFKRIQNHSILNVEKIFQVIVIWQTLVIKSEQLAQSHLFCPTSCHLVLSK